MSARTAVVLSLMLVLLSVSLMALPARATVSVTFIAATGSGVKSAAGSPVLMILSPHATKGDVLVVSVTQCPGSNVYGYPTVTDDLMDPFTPQVRAFDTGNFGGIFVFTATASEAVSSISVTPTATTGQFSFAAVEYSGVGSVVGTFSKSNASTSNVVNLTGTSSANNGVFAGNLMLNDNVNINEITDFGNARYTDVPNTAGRYCRYAAMDSGPWGNGSTMALQFHTSSDTGMYQAGAAVELFPPTADFTVSASPSSATTNADEPIGTTIFGNVTGSPSDTVSLSTTIFPTDAGSASCSPASVDFPSQTSVCTFTPTAPTASGKIVLVNVTGSDSGGNSHAVTFTVTVRTVGMSLSSPGNVTGTVGQGVYVTLTATPENVSELNVSITVCQSSPGAPKSDVACSPSGTFSIASGGTNVTVFIVSFSDSTSINVSVSMDNTSYALNATSDFTFTASNEKPLSPVWFVLLAAILIGSAAVLGTLLRRHR